MEIQREKVDRLKAAFLQRKTTTRTSKILLDTPEVKDMLLASYIAEVESRGGVYQESEELNDNLQKVAVWLTVKGAKPWLFLTGKLGNGKSTLMKAIVNLYNYLLYYHKDKVAYDSNFVITPARYIANKVKDGESTDNINRLTTQQLLAIDDLGVEPEAVMNYGNVINPLTECIYKRYDLQLPTIFTSNLAPNECAGRYGDRVADRLKEMCMKIKFTNNSYR